MKTTSPEYSPGDSYCPNLPSAPLPEVENKTIKQNVTYDSSTGKVTEYLVQSFIK